ncbi:hypothetical protein DICVIV_11534 [Dictyocaulus viviparus]|uniref:Uncharacterized protein n=1 Tax=Dictyocaulus viviparus TaxID=29172 RepID=A0A0D8XJG6_DICVI|nr:hypothetical protein DICVIV_11534 [Dictyocaulus viviparus]
MVPKFCQTTVGVPAEVMSFMIGPQSQRKCIRRRFMAKNNTRRNSEEKNTSPHPMEEAFRINVDITSNTLMIDKVDGKSKKKNAHDVHCHHNTDDDGNYSNQIK